MFCKYCGHEISDNAKFCDECGKKITEDQPVSRICPYCAEPLPKYAQMCRNCLNDIPDDGQLIKPKKQKKKRGPIGCLVWAAIILIVFGSCSAAILDDDPEPAAESEATIISESINDVEDAETYSSDRKTYDEIALFIESEMKKIFEYVELSYDETCLNIFVSGEGIESLCAFAKENAEIKKSWNEVLDSMVNLSKTVTDGYRDNGYSDYAVTISILSDKDKDTVLAITIDGKLVYDAASVA